MPYYQTKVVGRSGHPELRIHWLRPEECSDEETLADWLESWFNREHGHRYGMIEYGIALVPGQDREWKLKGQDKISESSVEWACTLVEGFEVRVVHSLNQEEGKSPNWTVYVGTFDPNSADPMSGLDVAGYIPECEQHDALPRAMEEAESYLDKMVEGTRKLLAVQEALLRGAIDMNNNGLACKASPKGAKYEEPKRKE